MPRRPTASSETIHDFKLGELEKDVLGLNSRFDRHLEIYAQNGKELAALKVSTLQVHEALQDLTTAVKSMDGKFASKEALTAVDKKTVNLDQFWPVKTLVYGVVGLMLTSVVGALLILIIKV